MCNGWEKMERKHKQKNSFTCSCHTYYIYTILKRIKQLVGGENNNLNSLQNI